MISQFLWVRSPESAELILLLQGHLRDCSQGCSLNQCLIRRLNCGRMHFQAHPGCWQNSVLQGMFDWEPASHWQLAIGHQFLATWASQDTLGEWKGTYTFVTFKASPSQKFPVDFPLCLFCQHWVHIYTTKESEEVSVSIWNFCP